MFILACILVAGAAGLISWLIFQGNDATIRAWCAKNRLTVVEISLSLLGGPFLLRPQGVQVYRVRVLRGGAPVTIWARSGVLQWDYIEETADGRYGPMQH